MVNDRGAVLVVYNPAKVNERKLRESVATHAPRGTRVEWAATTPYDDGHAQAAAARPGIGTVVVAGGDGTVRAVAAALAGSGVRLAVVPAGTGNLLARNLGMDLDLDASVRRAFAGRERPVDFCPVTLHRPDGTNERSGFTVMAGLGIDTGMIEHTDERLKKRIGPLAYGQGILRSLARGRNVKVTYTVDGERVGETRLHTLILGNCGQLLNEFPLFPAARPDDGLFDLVAMAPRGPFGWIDIGNRLVAAAVRAALGRPRPEESPRRVVPRRAGVLEYAQGTRATVQLAAPHIFELDGDPVGEVTAVEVEIRPGALRVMGE
ncbi:diacylglycerol kinase family protein [uncultured Corynebacterium sp.]|uniref:diacylglycerol/lipid kinase family protein n=1 Tax=uncultured Corynebacterium sp. TaxID=159447 RepID=UPI0025973E2C|nr:diacylglycerol kinase family protein [uncultured Corynebacterium sp.]